MSQCEVCKAQLESETELKIGFCWVCTRLKVSVEKEATDTHDYFKGSDD